MHLWCATILTNNKSTISFLDLNFVVLMYWHFVCKFGWHSTLMIERLKIPLKARRDHFYYF